MYARVQSIRVGEKASWKSGASLSGIGSATWKKVEHSERTLQPKAQSRKSRGKEQLRHHTKNSTQGVFRVGSPLLKEIRRHMKKILMTAINLQCRVSLCEIIGPHADLLLRALTATHRIDDRFQLTRVL